MEERTGEFSSATEALNSFTEEAIRDYKRMLRLMPVAYEFLALAFRNKTVQTALSVYFRRYMETLVPIIKMGVEAGEFRAVDPHEAAVAIGAIYEGTVLLWVYDSSLVNLEKHIRSSMQMLLEGLKT